MLPFSAYCLKMLNALYLYHVSRKYLKGFQLLSRHILIFTKGHNAIQNVGGVMVLVQCTSSDNVLYFSQVL